MHDPMHVVFNIYIPLPWFDGPKTVVRGGERRRNPLRRLSRISLATIWHVDPCIGGDDDSCSRCHLPRHKELVSFWGGVEANNPWFRRERAREPSSPADAESLLRGALWHTVRGLRFDRWSIWHKRMTFTECSQLACELLHNPDDNLRGMLCLLPGYHSNDRMVVPPTVDRETLDVDSAEYDQYLAECAAKPLDHYPLEASKYWRNELGHKLFQVLHRILHSDTRRWWQRPRWHVHHWRLDIHALRKLRRWLFARCCICHKRFGWNECPHASWGGEQMWHGPCSPGGMPKKEPSV